MTYSEVEVFAGLGLYSDGQMVNRGAVNDAHQLALRLRGVIITSVQWSRAG